MLECIFNTESTDFTFSNSNLLLQQIPIYLRLIGLKVILLSEFQPIIQLSWYLHTVYETKNGHSTH